jgi:hypothetical protein
MKALPNDCARCTSEHGCPLAATCRRTVAIPSGATLVIMSDFPGGDDCAGYLPEDSATTPKED